MGSNYNRRRLPSIGEAATHPKVRVALSEAIAAADLVDATIEPFAQGGAGVLFLVEQLGRRRMVLKVPCYASRPGEEHKLLERSIAKERRILEQLACRGTPRLLHAEAQGRYLIRSYIEGTPLADVGRSPTGQDSQLAAILMGLLRLARTLFETFHENPSRCYVIRDFKPANIVIGRSGAEMTLVDVGSARPEGEMVSRTRRAHQLGSGKWVYWAPEQLMEKEDCLDRRADYFALGATAFFVMWGCAPYDNLEAKPEAALARYERQYARVREMLFDRAKMSCLPGEITVFLVGCLRPEPKERPRDATPLWLV